MYDVSLASSYPKYLIPKKINGRTVHYSKLLFWSHSTLRSSPRSKQAPFSPPRNGALNRIRLRSPVQKTVNLMRAASSWPSCAQHSASPVFIYRPTPFNINASVYHFCLRRYSKYEVNKMNENNEYIFIGVSLLIDASTVSYYELYIATTNFFCMHVSTSPTWSFICNFCNFSIQTTIFIYWHLFP